MKSPSYDRLSEIFRARLRVAREGAGMSVNDLAQRLGQSDNSVRGYENGRTLPSLATAVRISEALGADLNWLVGREDAQKGRGPDDDPRGHSGSRIHSVRLALGLRQEDVARAVGISQPSQGNYERGHLAMTLDIAVRYADALGLDLDWLAGRKVR